MQQRLAPSLWMIWSLPLVVPSCSRYDRAPGATVKLNKGGLICSGMYTACFLVLIGFGYFVPFADPKMGGVYIALAMMPAALFLSILGACLGFRDFPSPASWLNSLVFFTR
jgi:hypothetical protein